MNYDKNPPSPPFSKGGKGGLGRLYFNQDQCFKELAKEVWEYQIGGYQVCDKWLKDRKRKQLSLDHIKHYCEIVTALQKIMKIQKEIDDIYSDVEKAIA